MQTFTYNYCVGKKLKTATVLFKKLLITTGTRKSYYIHSKPDSKPIIIIHLEHTQKKINHRVERKSKQSPCSIIETHLYSQQLWIFR